MPSIEKQSNYYKNYLKQSIMKITKILFAIALLSLSTFAKAAGTISEPQAEKALSQEVKALIQSANITSLGEGVTTVNFMLNSHNQIMVTSTSNAESDAALKEILNYKKLNIDGLDAYKIYTIRVKIEKL